MTDEREKQIKVTDDGQEADVEGHKLQKANEEKGSDDEPETPEVEGHAHVKVRTK